MDFWNIEDKFPISRLLSVAIIILSFLFPFPLPQKSLFLLSPTPKVPLLSSTLQMEQQQ